MVVRTIIMLICRGNGDNGKNSKSGDFYKLLDIDVMTMQLNISLEVSVSV